MNIRSILSKLLSFLRVKPMIGGLEISDVDLKFAYLNDGSLETASLRLPPGIIENGEIKNYDLLIEALKKLRELTPASFHNKKLANVVVTLNSIHIYTQVFSLPLIENNSLNEAIQLNISMVSPFDLSQAYAGWQLIDQNKSELKVEILSAFAQKVFIDQLRNALIESGFFPVAIESGALSLARLVREEAVDFKMEKPLLVLSIDDKGMRFLIIRLGQLHFEYFQSWKDIQGDEKIISWEYFDTVLKRNLHQVLNFYGSHWQEPLTDVVIASSSFVEEISKTVRENFSLDAKELKLSLGTTIGRDWYETVGGAIRGTMPRGDDKDVNLFGVTVQEEFRQEQISEFIKFWQVMIPSSLAILIVAMISCYLFFFNLGKSIDAQSAFAISGQRMEEINSLSAEIKDFNSSVKMLSALENSAKPKTALLNELIPIINKNDIAIDRISYTENTPVSLSGETNSQDNILNFKNALVSDAYFSSVNLSLSDIKSQVDGFSFIISFSVK